MGAPAAPATGAVPSTQAGAAAADAWAPRRIRQRTTGSCQQATGSSPKPPDREGRRPALDLLESGTDRSTEVACAEWGGRSGCGEVDPPAPVPAAPPASSSATSPKSTARTPWEGGREGEDLAATFLAVDRTSGGGLRRQPGQGGTQKDPTAAARGVPPESPHRESDAGALRFLVLHQLKR